MKQVHVGAEEKRTTVLCRNRAEHPDSQRVLSNYLYRSSVHPKHVLSTECGQDPICEFEEFAARLAQDNFLPELLSGDVENSQSVSLHDKNKA